MSPQITSLPPPPPRALTWPDVAYRFVQELPYMFALGIACVYIVTVKPSVEGVGTVLGIPLLARLSPNRGAGGAVAGIMGIALLFHIVAERAALAAP